MTESEALQLMDKVASARNALEIASLVLRKLLPASSLIDYLNSRSVALDSVFCALYVEAYPSSTILEEKASPVDYSKVPF